MRVFHAATIALTIGVASVGALMARQQDDVTIREIAVIPYRTDRLHPVLGGRRVYFQKFEDPSGGRDTLWMYDVASKKTTNLGVAVRAPTASPKGDLIAYRQQPEGGASPGWHIWTIPLDPRTGLRTGEPRRVSTRLGTDQIISPDGKWIAFGAVKPAGTPSRPTSSLSDTLIVVPSNGGMERAVVVQAGLLAPFSWSPDGRWIYFGTREPNPPRSRKVSRVAFQGGAPIVVARSLAVGPAWDPGVAPAGDLLALPRPHSYTQWGGITITRSDSIPIGTLWWPWWNRLPDTGHGWLSGSELFYHVNGPISKTVKAVDLASGKVREILPRTPYALGAEWSPGGDRIAITRMTPDSIVLLLTDAAGGKPRAVWKSKGVLLLHGEKPVWSPDGRLIALMAQRVPTATTEPPMAVMIIDVTTGIAKELAIPGRERQSIRGLRWMPDSRSVRYALTVNSDTTQVIREARMDGRDSLVGSFKTPGSPYMEFVSDTSVRVWGRGGTTHRSVNTGSSIPRDSGSAARSRGGEMLAKWVDASPRSLLVVSLSGNKLMSVTLPTEWDDVQFTPDASAIVAMSRTAADECCVLYAASIPGGQVRTLATIRAPLQINDENAPLWSISPDGKTVLVTFAESVETRLRALNLSGMMRRAGIK